VAVARGRRAEGDHDDERPQAAEDQRGQAARH